MGPSRRTGFLSERGEYRRMRFGLSKWQTAVLVIGGLVVAMTPPRGFLQVFVVVAFGWGAALAYRLAAEKSGLGR